MRSTFHFVTFPFFELWTLIYVYRHLRGSVVTPHQLQYQLKAKRPPCFLPPFTEVSDMSLFCVFTTKLFAVLPFGKNTYTHRALVNLSAPTHCDAFGKSPFAKWEKTAGYGAPTMRELTMRVPSIWTQIKQEWRGLRHFLQARYESNYPTCVP